MVVQWLVFDAKPIQVVATLHVMRKLKRTEMCYFHMEGKSDQILTEVHLLT
jgi:hypothetical protein